MSLLSSCLWPVALASAAIAETMKQHKQYHNCSTDGSINFRPLKPSAIGVGLFGVSRVAVVPTSPRSRQFGHLLAPSELFTEARILSAEETTLVKKALDHDRPGYERRLASVFPKLEIDCLLFVREDGTEVSTWESMSNEYALVVWGYTAAKPIPALQIGGDGTARTGSLLPPQEEVDQFLVQSLFNYFRDALPELR